jgi:hypothetical protein
MFQDVKLFQIKNLFFVAKYLIQYCFIFLSFKHSAGRHDNQLNDTQQNATQQNAT